MMKKEEFYKFKKELLKIGKLDLKRNFQIVEGLYEEAVTLGVFPLRDPLEGLEVDIRIARVVNSVPKTA